MTETSKPKGRARAARAALPAPAATIPPSTAIVAPTGPLAGSFTPQINANHRGPGGVPAPGGFQNATNGGEQRLAWARSNVGANAFAWGASGGVFYTANGGRISRDIGPAAAVSNELATSNPIIATLLLNLTTQAIGTGLTLSSKPDAAELGISSEEARLLSHAIETRWARWSSNPRECDFAGRFDIHQQASCTFRHALLNGEALAALEWRKFRDSETFTKVNVLDSMQLDRSVTRTEQGVNVYQGVGFDQAGRVVGYMVRNVALGSFAPAPFAKYIPAFTSWGRPKVLHIIGDFVDPRQIHGLSPLVGGLTPAHESETLGEFALGKAMLENQFAITVESALPTRVALDGLQVNEHAGNTDTWLTEREEIYGKARITPQVGTINHLAPGDALKFHRSETPNNTFDAFNKSLVRKAAKAAGSAVEDLSGDYSQTSFSASRLATALPHEINLRRRKDIVERFYKAVFEAFLEEQIERGLIEIPAGAKSFYEAKAAYCNAKFLGKGVVSPDPKKTTEGQLLKLENGLASFTEILAEDGKDFEAHVATLIEERVVLAKHGLDHPFFPGATTTQTKDENIAEQKQSPAQKPTKQRQARAALSRLEPYIAPTQRDLDWEVLA